MVVALAFVLDGRVISVSLSFFFLITLTLRLRSINGKLVCEWLEKLS